MWFDTVDGDAVLLTAAGCLWDNYIAETDGLDNTTPGLDGVEVFFGQSAVPGTALSIKDIVFHRYFDGGALGSAPVGNISDDLAIVILDGAPLTGGPAPLIENGQTLELEPGVTEVTMVGFGLDNETDPTSWDSKNSLTVPVNQVLDFHFTAGTATETTCQGDRGGPVFQNINGIETVIGINSRIGDECSNTTRRLRLDFYVEQFIASYVDCTLNQLPECDVCDFDGACSEECDVRDWDCELRAFAGEVCEANDDCERSNFCAPALDNADFTYCAEPCVLEGNSCNSSFECTDVESIGPVCLDTMPSPGAQGFDCSGNDVCISGICEDAICVDTCDPTEENACSGDFVCGPSRVKDDATVCLGIDLSSGGGFCSAGATGSSKSGLWFLLLAVLSAGFTLRRRYS